MRVRMPVFHGEGCVCLCVCWTPRSTCWWVRVDVCVLMCASRGAVRRVSCFPVFPNVSQWRQTTIPFRNWGWCPEFVWRTNPVWIRRKTYLTYIRGRNRCVCVCVCVCVCGIGLWTRVSYLCGCTVWLHRTFLSLLLLLPFLLCLI